MLPKEHKLSRVTFPKYSDPKKIWTGGVLRMQYSFVPIGDSARFAVVVAKKAHPSAVKRNLLKRLVYESMEHEGKELLGKKGLKMVIFPLKKSAFPSREEIEGDVRSFIAQL